MQYLDELKDKKITVLGLGVTGLGIVRFLLSHQVTPKVVDSCAVPVGADWLADNAPECEAVFGPLAEAGLSYADMVIISPGIALYESSVAHAIAAGVEVIGDIELFARLNNTPVVAVTGSNGKSTVVSLAAEVFKAAGLHVGLGGNIGTSVLALLDTTYDVVVLELSSFQLETTASLECRSAMILNVTEDHMDRYPNFAGYCAAKQRIYKHVEHVVFNADDTLTLSNDHKGTSVSIDGGDYSIATVNGVAQFSAHGKTLLPVSTLNMLGRHNQFNALAVLALLAPFNLSMNAFASAFSTFKGLEHRCQLVTEYNGVRYFNDSKATNVGATVAALESLHNEQGKILLILGGDAKGADLQPLMAPLQKYCKAIFCFGKDGAQFLRLHEQANLVSGLDEAVHKASSIASDGDSILLAPACASIDMYPNYMMRGEAFCKLVMELDV
ncbi:UDP-N-acetylmuramoyl-L-alanine--D-glutamate ligase [Pseudoalteromonas sp. MMG013]|uniref:UDP-N-acetylmuramoyl-L-alanine--D-glutamate ligase n=1 Tax=Pseudoalteromonas sp. MMG013 TaxID=2822687 RepID=UPI001B36E81F|nr:UDP-N-acetylmuramoyl-L-alanine--D-glutamate ligase [Pseudoalteromonas sp. MMG013]MBQ4860808.1 UDP-N-acetylmuramoyl-L-alanine--D-glutamate ligase [Pseudoalteromonas sp. MMG013]